MARFEQIQTNLTKGILTPRARGRIDFQGFFDAADALENVLVLPQGGAIRRPGTRFVKEVKFPERLTRVLPFEFSTTQTYIIETGDGYMRFYTNEGRLETTDVTASITNGTFATDITGWTDLSTGTGSIVHDTGNFGQMSMIDGNGISIAEQSVTITETTTDHYLSFTYRQGISPRSEKLEILIGSASGLSDLFFRTVFPGDHVIKFDPSSNATVFLRFQYTSTLTGATNIFLDNVTILDNVPVELITPYVGLELDLIKQTQSADIMFIAESEHSPRELRRLGADEFSLIFHDFMDGPYQPTNTTVDTLTASGTTGVVTITASGITAINNDQGFTGFDIGRVIRIAVTASSDTWYEIVGFTSAVIVTAIVRGGAGVTTAQTRWRLGEWHGPNDYPKVTQFHEERLWWANTDLQVATFWGSKTQDFNNHEPNALADLTVADNNAINSTIASNTVNAIHWMNSIDQGLLIGTSGSEVLISPASTTKGLAPDAVKIRVQTNRGSKGDLLPARIGRSTVFVQRSGLVIREASFDLGVEGLVAPPISVISEHLFRLKIERLAFAQDPIPLLWSITNDGKLQGFTTEPSQNVAAWHLHPIGDASAGGIKVEDGTTIPDGTDTEDQLWLVVKRTIGGTKRYIEFIETLFESETAIADAFFVDSGLTGASSGETELVTNGTFTTDLSGWTVTGTVVQVGGAAAYGPSGSEMILDQNLTTTGPNILHTLSLDTTVNAGDANQDFLVSIGTTLGASDILAVQTITGSKTGNSFTFTPGATSFFIRIRKASGTVAAATIDNVSCESSFSFLTGLGHLIGETVQILIDGATHPSRVVDSDGIVQLDSGRSGTKVHAGLKQGTNGALVGLLPFDSGTEGQTTIGKKRKPHQVIFRFDSTVGAKAGDTVAKAKEILFRKPSDPMDAAVPPFTGIKSLSISTRHERGEHKVVVFNDQPLPFHLLTAVTEYEVWES